MGDTDRRRSYAYNRILIESDRILTPQFSDAVVFLTGAQVELLRNVTSYLNRRETYVKATEMGYYMMPTDADFDDILEIVADLEETLMGNPNTLWGYKESWRERKSELSCDAGDNTLTHTAVAAGEVWVVESLTVWNINTHITKMRIYVSSGGASYVLHQFTTPLANNPETLHTWLTLKAGDVLSVVFSGCVENDDIYSDVMGHKMTIST